jgi:hypothetical protein
MYTIVLGLCLYQFTTYLIIYVHLRLTLEAVENQYFSDQLLFIHWHLTLISFCDVFQSLL